MGDIISIHAPHAPQWKRLYEAAILELDPAKLLDRIVVAQSAVINQLEDGLSKPSDRQQLALHDALHMLSTLRTIAERDIGETLLSKTRARKFSCRRRGIVASSEQQKGV